MKNKNEKRVLAYQKGKTISHEDLYKIAGGFFMCSYPSGGISGVKENWNIHFDYKVDW